MGINRSYVLAAITALVIAAMTSITVVTIWVPSERQDIAIGHILTIATPAIAAVLPLLMAKDIHTAIANGGPRSPTQDS